MGGHVFGDEPEAEWRELERVTKPGGWVILCPGNNDVEDESAPVPGCAGLPVGSLRGAGGWMEEEILENKEVARYMGFVT